MPIYNYRAIDSGGNPVSGELSANNEADLKLFLNKKGYVLLKQTKKSSIFFGGGAGRIKTRDIIIFSRQLSVMISAGITIHEAIQLLADSSEKAVMRKHLRNIHDDLKAGYTLSECMKRTGAFDEFMIGMVKVGEISGAFDDIMKRVADFYEKDGAMRRSVKSALMYPCILVFVTVLVIIYMMVGLIPQFEGIFAQLDAGELPGLTLFVTNVSRFFIKNIVTIVAVTAAAVGALTYSLRTDYGKFKRDALALKLPVVKNVTMKMATSRFARCMDILTKSGVSIAQSFDLVNSMITNRVIRQEFKKCKEATLAGHSYSSSLAKVVYFPKMLINMVMVGEKSGSLSEVFDRTSVFFDDEATEALKKMVQLIEPVMLVILGAVVLVIILAVMLPMISMMNAV